MTFGIFIPAFVLPIFFHRQWVALAENERLHAFLLGVAAGCHRPDRRGHDRHHRHRVVDGWTAALAILAFAALNRWHGKLTVLYVVVGCGLAGPCCSSWSSSLVAPNGAWRGSSVGRAHD